MRPLLHAESRPRLPRGVRLRFDPVRGVYVLLAPERVLFPDEISVAVLERCDGSRSVSQLSAELARRYEGAEAQIERDVLELLQSLADRGYVRS